MKAQTKYARMFKLIRLETGLTQRDLAKELGIGPGSLYKYENDMMSPGVKVVEKAKHYIEQNDLQINLQTDIELSGLAEVQIDDKDSETEKETLMKAQYIIDLQKDNINLLQEKIEILKNQIKEQPKAKTTQIITTATFETIDFDFQTFQTYDKRDFGYFKTYKIINYVEFFNKLGYHGEEGKLMHQKHMDSMDYKNRKTNRANDENFLIHRDSTDDALYDRDITNRFFKQEIAAQTVSKMTRFNLNYKHKDGSYIPAILHCLWDFDNLSGISKIKFLDKQEMD